MLVKIKENNMIINNLIENIIQYMKQSNKTDSIEATEDKDKVIMLFQKREISELEKILEELNKEKK